jgi:hypothetical protein
MASADLAVTLQPFIEALTIRPGDTLIVRVDPSYSPAEVAELKAAIADRLPDLAVVVIAADQIAAYRPGDTDDG